MQQLEIGVIGGGAAGMTAAIAAAGQGARVTLLEGGERVGKKLLATGNGKCNISNLDLDEDKYYTQGDREWVRDALWRFPVQDTVRFFRGMGLFLKSKNGYLYPLAEQASVVLDTLRTALRDWNVRVVTGAKVQKIHKSEKGKFVVKTSGEEFLFDRVILACGSKAAPKTGSDGSGYELAKSLGHSIVDIVPALVQLRCRENYLKGVAGVRVDAEVSVLEPVEAASEGEKTFGTDRKKEDGFIRERGELQLTDYGISGIPVFQLSRFVNYRLQDHAEITVRIDCLPDYSGEELEMLLAERMLLLDNSRTVEEFFTGILNKKLMYQFLKLCGLKADECVEKVGPDKLRQVLLLCKDWKLHVNGSNSYDSAQVCAGGVNTGEIDGNMQSRIIPGLYFAGEIMDVDGRCGGYNLQWAWCSGYLAGMAAGENRA